MEPQKAEGLARSLIQATERSFRSHLGERARDRDFIGELYLGLRRTLAQLDDAGVHETEKRRGIVDELALTAYLIAASRHPGAQVDPELLESLRGAIARALSGTGQTPTAPAS
ncbi:MAG: hypothetical protein HZC42_03840 [Candidatus Eisenbacteria bacterium]|nr:hypothetical protein [Candidatus Eisenbacteria bacterium]